MKISEMFPSKYLKAEDVVTVPLVLTIDAVPMESMPDGSRKAVLMFREIRKGLVCNKRRCNSLYSITGSDDSTDWIGHRISLAVGEETFKGDIVPSVRIKAPHQEVAAAARSLPVQGSLTEEEIPF